MLTAKKVLIQDSAKKLCELCSTQYDADLLYYAIYENDGSVMPPEKEIPTVSGVCGFRFVKGGAVIEEIVPKKDTYDLEAMYILGKATLNFIDLCGIKKVKYLAADKKLAKHLEFTEDGDLDLTDYFMEPCKRHAGKSSVAKEAEESCGK